MAEITLLREERERAATRQEALEGNIASLRIEVAELEDRASEREAAVEVLREEARVLGREKAESDAALEAARAENVTLINTILEIKEREADRMNAANDYYDNTVAEANRHAQRIQIQAASGLNAAMAGAAAGAWSAPVESFVSVPRAVKHRLEGAHDACVVSGRIFDRPIPITVERSHPPHPYPYPTQSNPILILTNPSHPIPFPFPPHPLLLVMQHGVRFSGDGDLFATCSADQTIKLWEPRRGTLVSTLQGALGSVLDVRFASDASFVIAAGADGALRMWDVGSGRSKHTLTGHRDKVHAVAVSAAERTRCVSGGQDRTLRIWDLHKGYCVQTIACGSTCFDVALSHDGGCIYSGHFDGSLRVWDFRTGSLEMKKEGLHAAQVSAVLPTPSGRQLVTTGKDHAIRLVDLCGGGCEVQRTFVSAGMRLSGTKVVPSVSPDDAFVACGAQDGALFVWSATTGEERAALRKHRGGGVVCTAWSPAAGYVVSCDQKGDVFVWE